MEIIRAGTNFDFMGRRSTFLALSFGLLFLSALSLAVFGFNRGIDFKGGTKVIVAFKKSASVDRTELRSKLNHLVSETVGSSDAGQIEVQDFDTGGAIEEVPRQHFMLLTELTTLVTPEQKQKIAQTLVQTFGEGTRVEIAAEGEDRFYLTLPQKAKVNETYAKLRDTFKALNFPQIQTMSEVERAKDVDFFKSINLEIEEGGEEAAAAVLATEETFKKQKVADLENVEDTVYTITIEELKAKLDVFFASEYKDAFVQVESATIVSPAVAEDLLNQGLLALLYACIGITIYIALRFDIRYAPGALIALIHDVVITAGAFSVAQIKFTMPIVAALLTIAGYSINDTIVVFDRIRENISKHKGVALRILVNHAINETLSRTILVSLTVFLTVVAIFVLGGGQIRDFAFAMIIGVIVGTYSSVFIASPFFLMLDEYFDKKRAEARETSVAARI